MAPHEEKVLPPHDKRTTPPYEEEHEKPPHPLAQNYNHHDYNSYEEAPWWDKCTGEFRGYLPCFKPKEYPAVAYAIYRAYAPYSYIAIGMTGVGVYYFWDNPPALLALAGGVGFLGYQAWDEFSHGV